MRYEEDDYMYHKSLLKWVALLFFFELFFSVVSAAQILYYYYTQVLSLQILSKDKKKNVNIEMTKFDNGSLNEKLL